MTLLVNDTKKIICAQTLLDILTRDRMSYTLGFLFVLRRGQLIDDDGFLANLGVHNIQFNLVYFQQCTSTFHTITIGM